MSKRERECRNCLHPSHADGWQFTMLGECENCPECDALVQERYEEDRRARPAQYPVK